MMNTRYARSQNWIGCDFSFFSGMGRAIVKGAAAKVAPLVNLLLRKVVAVAVDSSATSSPR